MYVLLGLVTVVGGTADVDDDGVAGDDVDVGDDDGQFLTFLMAGTAIAGGSLQRNVWRNNQNG